MNKINLLLFALTITIIGCDEVADKQKLNIYGNPQIIEKTVNGEIVYDTVDHTVGYFRLFNQDSTVITPANLDGKVYVTDFFFTSCISICPEMSKQMLRIHDQFKNRDSLALVSFSIDPEFDTVAVLKNYSERLGVSSDKWHFLTGDKDEIYTLAFNSYLTERPADDPEDENNILHSGAFILIDTQKRIRGVYDGTVPDQVDLLMKDIDKLLSEENESGS